MINRQKDEMLTIMEKYITDENYRRIVNSKDFSKLSELEQIALKNMLVTNEGIEVVESNLSNHYSSFNPIDIDTEQGLINTCMNMAIAYLLHQVFMENNINKYPNFNLNDIKTRIKGDLFSTMDKPTILNFIKFYNKAFPNYLPKKTQEYLRIYHGHIKNGVGTATFLALAQTLNTNIYLDELVIQKEQKSFWERKK